MNKSYTLNSTTLTATVDEKFDLTKNVVIKLKPAAEEVDPAVTMDVDVLVNDEVLETVTLSSDATTPSSITVPGNTDNESIKLRVSSWTAEFESVVVDVTGEAKPEPKPEPSTDFETATKVFKLVPSSNDCTVEGLVLSEGITATATVTGKDASYNVVVNTIINGKVTAKNSVTMEASTNELNTDYPTGTVVKAVGFGVDLFPSDVLEVRITVTGKVYKPSATVPQGVSGVIMAEPGIAQFTVENGGTTGNKLDEITGAYPIIPDAVYQAPYDKVDDVDLTYTDRQVPARIKAVSTSKGNIYTSNKDYKFNIEVRCSVPATETVVLTFVANQLASKLLLDDTAIDSADNKFTITITSAGYRQKFSHTLKSLSDETDITTINIDFIPVQ